ncbi:hypothetical protein H257_10600 [Aphanomyces astaci]|uniref:Uncharacterized protein n=1 Tax=Aphanomyces astaci TaxID=112090 RepID=W4G6T2_APHAT|nr:hypothetical protein H257_10600 [Aphanomyces astaci]ETV74996.1 hypothetical protein H257_10600 [Aphanomyces astaci]|eukprot:XP_009835500.1 hypothetical protein H257_10600 [Aphanomyces astaci]
MAENAAAAQPVAATTHTSNEIRASLQGCMIQNQVNFCVGGVVAGVPISIYSKKMYPFAVLGVLGSFIDYSFPYDSKCVELKRALDAALAREKAQSISFPDSSS